MEIYEYLKENPLFYVARDIERALGIEPKDGYFIITNETSYSKEIQKKYPHSLHLIKENEILDTSKLLLHPETKKFIDMKRGDKPVSIIVFKNSKQIEIICAKNAWKLLNPSAQLSEKIEGKMSQEKWLGELKKYLPPFKIEIGKDIAWEGKPFIIQFNHGHTGEGTLLIENESELIALQQKFPQREVKKSVFIQGHVFTNNNIVTSSAVLMGSISYQITGLYPFTDNRFSTIGNDWAFPSQILTREQTQIYKKIAKEIGEQMQRDGWKGIFGIDIIREEQTGKLFLLEINARQTASSVFESKLQKEKDKNGLTIFEAHLLSLLLLKSKKEIIPIESGSQIVQRVTKKILTSPSKLNTKALAERGLFVLEYENTELNADKYRIQSSESIMKNTSHFNDLGKFIKKALI